MTSTSAHEGGPIVRMWTGEVPRDKADEYLNLMKTVAIPDYRSTEGNEGAYVLHRHLGDRTEFIMLTMWESRESIKAFAGADIDVAKYYEFDTDFLLEMTPHVDHFDVFG